MDVLDGIGEVFSGGMTVKAESDYWNSHSDSYRAQVWLQILIGVPLFLFAAWSYYYSGANATFPILLFVDYLCCCWVVTSFRNLGEKSFVSQNFSEFWLFGFFKGDDYLCGVIFGGLGALVCTYLMANMLFASHHLQITNPKVPHPPASAQSVSAPPAVQPSHQSAHHVSVKPAHYLNNAVHASKKLH